MRPNSAAVTVTFGLFRFRRLKTLKMSARSSSFVLPNRANFFRADRSHWYQCGPSIRPIGALPRRPSGAVANAAVLNHWFSSRLSHADLAAQVVGAAGADRRVAGRRQVLARLPAYLATELPPSEDRFGEIGLSAVERHRVGERVDQRVPPIVGGRPDEEVEVEGRARDVAFGGERVVAVAAAEAGGLRERVADGVAEAAAPLVQIQLQPVVVREGIAAPLPDRRIATVRTQEVGVGAIRGRERRVRREDLERGLVDFRLPQQVTSPVADVGHFREVPPRQLALDADAVIELTRTLAAADRAR